MEPAKIIEERNKLKDEAKEAAANTEGESKPISSALQSLLNPPESQDSRRTTPTPQESEKPEAGPRARRTGIRRPDVLRKAEQAVMRSMEPKVCTTKSRIGSISSGKRGSQTPVAAMSEDGSDEEGPDAQVRREAEEGMADVEMKDTEGEEHKDHHLGRDGDEENDGDDESDLSDAPEASDEEIPPGLMFPNLRRDETATQSSGEEADSESEGDEAGDEAEEAEEAEEEDAAEEADEAEEAEHGDEDEEDPEAAQEEGEGLDDGDMEIADADDQGEGDEGSYAGEVRATVEHGDS